MNASKSQVLKCIKNNLSVTTITGIMDGVLEDVKKFDVNEHGHQPMSPFFTLGDLREVGDFEAVEELMDHIIAGCIGRALRFTVMEMNPKLMNNESFLIKAAKSTDKVQADVLKMYMLKSRRTNPNPSINQQKVDEIFARVGILH